jgi:TorA maturation chaperone TorD
VTIESAPVTFSHRIEPEDQARADFYALLARLFADAPDRALLAAIAAAPPLEPATILDSETASPAERLAASWDALRAASAAMDAEAAKYEYDELFVGVGKSEVNLHASHWLTGFMMEKPLADVRSELARLGVGREPSATLVEDHLSPLCEVMRLLITGRDDRRPATVSEQRAFFARFLQPWTSRCCAAISQHPIANYYRRVGQFADAFLAIERDALALDT